MEALAVIGLAIPTLGLLLYVVQVAWSLMRGRPMPELIGNDQVGGVFFPAIMFMALGFRAVHGRFPAPPLSEAITLTLVIAMGSVVLSRLVQRWRASRLPAEECAESSRTVAALAPLFGVAFAILVGVGNPDW